jgi:hypothetical protein
LVSTCQAELDGVSSGAIANMRYTAYSGSCHRSTSG